VRLELKGGSNRDKVKGFQGGDKGNKIKQGRTAEGKEEETGERSLEPKVTISLDKALVSQGASSSEPSDGADGQPSVPRLESEDSTQTEFTGAGEFTPANTGVKRGRDPLSSGSCQPLRKRVAAAEPKRLFSAVVDGAEELYILPRTNLQRHLQADEFQLVRRELESRVFRLEGEFISQIRVLGFELVRGRGFVSCSNRFTSDWIRAQFNDISGSLYAYKVCKKEELPAVVYRRVFCWYPRAEVPEKSEFLQQLQLQNSEQELDVGAWRLHSATLGVGGRGRTLILDVPECVFQVLVSNNMTLFYGLGILSFREDSKAEN